MPTIADGGEVRRRLQRLAALAAVLAIVVPATVSWSGALQEASDRLTDLVVEDPGVSRDLVVIGLTDPRLWPLPAEDEPDPADPEVLDADRLRLQALVRTIEALLARDARLVVLTDTISNEDLTREDAGALVDVLASGRVLLPYLDDVPVTAAEGVLRRFRPPLSVTSSLPLAHAVVDDPGPGDRVRTMAVTERWTDDGESHEFFALPLAALAAVAQVPIDRTDHAIVAGSVTVPLEDGRLRINWTDRLVQRVPGTVAPAGWRDDVPFVDASEVVAGADADVAGRVALVGTIDPLQARYVGVPGGPQSGVPELWVHANALNTVLVGAPLGTASRVELVLWLAAAALGMATVALRRPPAESALWLVAAVVVALVAVATRGGAGVLVDPVALLGALALAWGGTFLARYAVEGRQRRRVADLFRRYVPDAVAEQLIEEEVGVDELAAGTRTEVTVLFCDLRGFTEQAGALEPGQVRDLLNVYYRHTTGVVLEHGGTVMQYVGDEVFAVFGAPLAQPDHADRAIGAAVGMQSVATAVTAELAAMGIGPVAYGIGVNSGSVVAAHVGDAARTQYAVVGDTVNVGARLCSQAGAGEVVVSADVLQRLAEPPEVVPLGSVPLKGVTRDLPIHRLVQGSTRQEPDG